MNQITEFRTPAPSPAQALLHSSGIHNQEKIREEENQGAPEEGTQGAPEELQGVPE